MAGRRRQSASIAVAAGPDEGVGVPAFGRDQRGEDRRREAWIVKLNREIFAASGRGLLPGRAKFGRAGEDAVIGSLVVLFLGPRNLSLDVERERLDRAGEIALGHLSTVLFARNHCAIDAIRYRTDRSVFFTSAPLRRTPCSDRGARFASRHEL